MTRSVEQPLSADEPRDLPPGLEDDMRWQLARRIAASRRFAKSRFLSEFVLYVCEKHLLDRTGEITEQQIGEQVFRRPAGYSPSEDNIVRNYARLLRQRLDEYFAGEGAGEPLRLAIPRGGYVPIFIETGSPVGEARAETPPAASDVESSEQLRLPSQEINHPLIQPVGNHEAPRVSRSLFLSVLALCGLLMIALLYSWKRASAPEPQTINDRFWSSFFSPARDTLLVPADSGLAIYVDLTHRPVSLGEYVRGDYAEHAVAGLAVTPQLVTELGTRRYTSVVDLHLVSAISQLPYVVHDRFKVRYAREIQLDDLKESNAILLGSISANPWVELFQKGLNFQFEPHANAGDLIVHNLHPRPGEKPYYQTDQTHPLHTTYGLIAVTSNLSGTGHVLLIEGINMAGTEAAADCLFSDVSRPLLQRVLDSRGDLTPFEALIETSNIGANAPRAQIIAQRIYSR